MGSMNFGMASPYIETFGIAKAAAAKVFSVIDNIPIINVSKGNGTKPDRIEGNIKFNNVNFHYPSRKAVKVPHNFNYMQFVILNKQCTNLGIARSKFKY